MYPESTPHPRINISSTATDSPTSPSYFGYDIFTGTVDQAVAKLNHCIREKQQSWVCCLNVYKMAFTFRIPQFFEKISTAQLLITDGMSVFLTARLLGCRVKERVNGVTLFSRLLDEANKHNYKIFFLGSRPEVVETTVTQVHSEYPGIIVAGYRDGFFADPDEVLAQVRKTDADILFVALGSPKQELFIHEHRSKINARIVMGVGGSFDVFSGLTPRAPIVAQRLGLEWLFRCIVEPRKYLRRYYQVIPVFVRNFIKQYFADHKSNARHI